MSKTTATFVGFIAVLLWSLLALFTVGAHDVPALQLNAMCFAIGGGIGAIWTTATGQWAALRKTPLYVYLVGTTGIFGYHYLYFSALKLAPPAEAGLIAYLWPLLIVLFSGLLPGERLRVLHLCGALLAFAGAALIVARGSSFDGSNALGYLLALGCALTWSIYSVASRLFHQVPSAAVTVFCLLSALLSGGAHLAVEETLWPLSQTNALATLALGIGPVGLAFYVWDIGVKRGNIQLLGTASYAAPLLSTLVLVAANVADPTPTLALSAVLITIGAGLAAIASRQT